MAMSCRDMEVVAGCIVAPPALPQPVLIHYEYAEGASGQVLIRAVRYTDAAGLIVTVPAGGTVVAGACPMVKTDVEDQLLCDQATPAPAAALPFLRRYTRVYNTADGSLIKQTVNDFGLDGTTAFAISAPANVSNKCTGSYAFTEVTVCDANNTTFVRRDTVINGAAVVLGFFDPSTGAPATPVGSVGACATCGPAVPAGVLATWG